MNRKILLSLSLLYLFLANSSATPQMGNSAHFRIQTFSSVDANYLPRAFKALEKARKDLLALGLKPPQRVTVIVHPTLERFQKSLKAPMFEAARANRNSARIETQRFIILEERGGLEQTLRHELFHLAQPLSWPRWKAEGGAVRFSGERLNGVPFDNISESKLEALLKNPPSKAMLARAMATALEWVVQNRAVSN